MKKMIRYTHDCESCILLGAHKEFDLYYCPTAILPTLIARASCEPSDYTSMPVSILETNLSQMNNDDHEQVQALLMAYQFYREESF